jgi:hypothetical protein
MSDAKLMVGKGESRDYEQEFVEYMSELEEHFGASNDVVTTSFVPFSRNLEGDGITVEQDVNEKEYITIKVTLPPWQARQAIEFLRHLPDEPRDDG